MADHQQIMDLAQKGALAQKREHYSELLTEIDIVCAAIRGACFMMTPGNLDEIKELEIALGSKKLNRLLPEARALKAELQKAGVYVW